MSEEYHVGDRVWWARCDTRQVTHPCHICYGKLRVTLILGNGDSVDLACDYCGKGQGGPTGIIREYEYVTGAEMVTITKVTTTTQEDGEKREYHSNGGWIPDVSDLFPTEAEALARCEEKTRMANEEQRTKACYLKKHEQKSYAWNAGYHLREAKRSEEEAKRHRDKAVLCKAREKGKEDA
jgi:hypothetical protein